MPRSARRRFASSRVGTGLIRCELRGCGVKLFTWGCRGIHFHSADRSKIRSPAVSWSAGSGFESLAASRDQGSDQVVPTGSEPHSCPVSTIGCSKGALEPLDETGSRWTGRRLVRHPGLRAERGLLASSRCAAPVTNGLGNSRSDLGRRLSTCALSIARLREWGHVRAACAPLRRGCQPRSPVVCVHMDKNRLAGVNLSRGISWRWMRRPAQSLRRPVTRSYPAIDYLRRAAPLGASR
jgi:hypothetical protein